MPDDRKKLTIYQIAELSGVSVSTISRVINNSPYVSARTKARVTDIINKHNFSPSSLARAMTSNHTKTLGVIVSDITNPYFSELYLEIQRYAVDLGYSIILCNTFYGGSNHGVSDAIPENTYFQMILDKQVDGVLILGGEIDRDHISDAYKEALNRMGKQIPVVILGESVPDCNCIFLNRNLSGGIPALIHHLLALGRRKIGFVGGEEGIRTTTARLTAYTQTLKNLGISFDSSLISLSNYYAPDGYRAMAKLLEQPETTPTAIICMNDAVAQGAIRAINDKGLSVPKDISVASCDQFPSGEYTSPRLTTLDQQNSYLGRMSIMTLINAINNDSEGISISHQPRLIIRESCGAHLGIQFQQ
ncbi:LacI family DNA-binding transcriptional regulator [Paenibacillus radicis (ex Gao et al. 2016)]|uniref:LacI family transcriptional regulator n=1 Tax=Paenibacillus radicis (ex Gao et al. 2016) TaxID=1737354 RepID=A0A917LWR2_9BACL|nr:LacI family DNA-binding transcriptional regulator [Paenibacillus radicis (ex Gao et al. 2016)]GGG60315.1 LacI family transcriptional regulator [Paenibacillus radicis (ex Gao et al. 2016)]